MVNNTVNKYDHNLIIMVQWHICETDTAGNKATALHAHGLVANCSTDIAGSGATNWLPIPYWLYAPIHKSSPRLLNYVYYGTLNLVVT